MHLLKLFYHFSEGQCSDSSDASITRMRRKSQQLHEKIAKFTDRRTDALLKHFLPEKKEFTIFLKMSESQDLLYRRYLDLQSKNFDSNSMLNNYHDMRKIWSHPKLLVTENENSAGGSQDDWWNKCVGHEIFEDIKVNSWL